MIDEFENLLNLVRDEYDSGPRSIAEAILGSSWLYQHDYATLKVFLEGCLEGLPSDPEF